MKILGLQKLTLLDYPGHIAAIVFTGGCNFRCPFCQNSSLVLSPEAEPEISEEDFFRFLRKRRGLLDGICVTGGEPTLHADLPEFLASVKSAGYLVKLDTNGTNPAMLRTLLADGLLDYAAMDVKAGSANYARVCGLSQAASAGQSQDREPAGPEHFERLFQSVRLSAELLFGSDIEYEFRTTAVKGLHTRQDFEEIASWLAGCRHYYLQSFRDCPEVLQQNHPFSAFPAEEMQEFLSLVQKKIPQAALRGL